MCNKYIYIINVGPDHMGVMMSPYPGVILDSWSVTNGTPLQALDWKEDRKNYFIYYCYAGEPVSLNFTINLKVRMKKS